mgnify:CR=1 FL=1
MSNEKIVNDFNFDQVIQDAASNNDNSLIAVAGKNLLNVYKSTDLLFGKSGFSSFLGNKKPGKVLDISMDKDQSDIVGVCFLNSDEIVLAHEDGTVNIFEVNKK